jgi:23S rRNA (uracil1939-C5)-methyltransferase
MSKSEFVKVKVHGLGVGGVMVGSVDEEGHQWSGMRAFIRNCVPGDVALVRVEKAKKNYLEGVAESILERSSLRVDASCKVADRCGGCDLQYVGLPYHEDLKTKLIAGMMSAQGLDASCLKPFVGGAKHGVRRRMKFRFDREGRFGLFKRKSREIVPLSDCEQLAPELRELLEPLRSALAEISLEGSIVLESNGVSRVVLLALADPPSLPKTQEVAERIAPLVDGGRVECRGRVLVSFGCVELELKYAKADVTLKLQPGSFSQVNWAMNERLVEQVVERVEGISCEGCWDLYSGAGNFAVPLAWRGYSVLAVEGDRRLAMAGAVTASRYKLPVDFRHSSVEKFLKNSKLGSPHVIIADPPRDGLKRAVELLPKANRMILISCHLPSFVRDARNLCDRGWNLKEVVPFEMFPLTNYVELMSVFE